jgi:hypothetical protein
LEVVAQKEKEFKELFIREFQFAAPGEELDLGDIEVEQ